MRSEVSASRMARRRHLVIVLAAIVTLGALTPAAWASAGDQVWVARDAGRHGAYDQLGGMVESPDGSTVYVARSSAGDIVVVAHDAGSGVRTWSIRVRDPRGAQLFADAVALSPDGSRLFVTGEVERSVGTR